VFRYCTFNALSLEGVQVDGILQQSTLTGCDFYWGHFNCALVADVRFVDCVFPGTSFRGARIIASRFEGCRFIPDNLGGEVTFDECLFAGCMFERCEWVVKAVAKRDVRKTQWLACQRDRCMGFDGLF
jgi:uncharacterized protein YjbI with pentapeptide repeats